MRVLIVTSYFWPENFRINDLAIGLRQKGHEITVLTGVPNYPAGKFFPGYGILKNLREVYQGISICRVPQFPRGNGRSWELVLNYFSSALMACILGPLFCREKYDVIIVPQLSPVTVGLPAILIKKLKTVPLIFWILDIWPESLSATGAIHSPFILGLVRRVVRAIYRQCDKILVSSRGFVQSIEATGGYAGHIEYFPNWVESEYMNQRQQGGGTGLPALPVGFIVMFAGNIGAAQDFATILLAAEKLREFSDIHWVILGDGREAEWVAEHVEKSGLGDQFHLLGRYPAETMPIFFSQAGGLLMTLRRDPVFALTAPGKLQSYMSSGKPIIAGLDGEGAQLVKDAGCGLTCPAENPTELAARILELYRMPIENRRSMGERGRVYCEEHFDRNKQFDKFEILIEQTIRDARTASETY